VSCAITAEPIDFLFGLWTRARRRKHKFNRIHRVAPMYPHGRTHCRHLANTIEPSVCSGDSAMSNYFDHLLSFATLTYTVAQIAERLEPNTVLWAFHTIQPSSFGLDCHFYRVRSNFWPRVASAMDDSHDCRVLPAEANVLRMCACCNSASSSVCTLH